jgi:hypothetical protein
MFCVFTTSPQFGQYLYIEPPATLNLNLPPAQLAQWPIRSFNGRSHGVTMLEQPGHVSYWTFFIERFLAFGIGPHCLHKNPLLK